MGRDRVGHQQPVGAARLRRAGRKPCRRAVAERLARGVGERGRDGQGTVEFAIVTAAVLAVVVGLGALWRAFEGGMFVEHAVASASHHVQGALGAVADVFMY